MLHPSHSSTIPVSSIHHPSSPLPSPIQNQRVKEMEDWLTSSHREPHSWHYNIADCQQFHQHIAQLQIQEGIPKSWIRRYQPGAPKSGGRNFNFFRRLDMVMILAWIACVEHLSSGAFLLGMDMGPPLFWIEPMWGFLGGLQFCKGSSRHSHGYGDDFGARELLSAWLGPAARICGREFLIFQISCTPCVSASCSIWMKFASRRCVLVVVTHSFWVKEWVINLF